jgi:hypothetical protein
MSRAFGYQSDKIAMLSTKLRLCPSSKYRAEHRTPMPHGDFHLGKIGAAPSNVPSASAVASLPDMPPLKLTDAELDAVFNAARPLAPNVREDFLKEVARLSSCPVVGPAQCIAYASRRSGGSLTDGTVADPEHDAHLPKARNSSDEVAPDRRSHALENCARGYAQRRHRPSSSARSPRPVLWSRSRTIRSSIPSTGPTRAIEDILSECGEHNG